ncbi:hypothetical protein CRG98_020800 [Punica granatum]|uniref:Uncharacterized protein n=1 Tax=Punica granatum TaxID=22663 RepID=A0A2I0JSE2_PUNGR|nr:hypothetical protein CRG98_020800 [Punica granatum]
MGSFLLSPGYLRSRRPLSLLSLSLLPLFSSLSPSFLLGITGDPLGSPSSPAAQGHGGESLIPIDLRSSQGSQHSLAWLLLLSAAGSWSRLQVSLNGVSPITDNSRVKTTFNSSVFGVCVNRGFTALDQDNHHQICRASTDPDCLLPATQPGDRLATAMESSPSTIKDCFGSLMTLTDLNRSRKLGTPI